MEFAVRTDPSAPAENQLLRRGFHAKLLLQFPNGGWQKIHPGRNMPSAGDIIASGPGILGFAPLLQKNLDFSASDSQQPDMGGPVPDALRVGFCPGHGFAGGHAVFVHHIQYFRSWQPKRRRVFLFFKFLNYHTRHALVCVLFAASGSCLLEKHGK